MKVLVELDKLIRRNLSLSYIRLNRQFSSQPANDAANILNGADEILPSEQLLDTIEQNVIVRKHKNNVPIIRSIVNSLRVDSDNLYLRQQLRHELNNLPNNTNPRLLSYGNEPHQLFNYVHKKFSNDVKEFDEVCRNLNLLRMDHLGNFTGHKSYYLNGQLAMLEQALVRHALQLLSNHNFKLMSVPDILPSDVIENCGMRTEGERTQVYKLDSGDCLSGTSEMALAGFFSDKIIEESELPLNVTATSRCFRAETSALHEEKGIYRVHQFTKVEMFAVCSEHQSTAELEHFKDIEVDFFKSLNLNFRLIDMPPCELGAPAFQKYDIEAWMPGRKMWGEISSCSNCTDYQARRLNIRYRTRDGQLKYAHTINGTAAAIPRLLISLIESNQDVNDTITIPETLKPLLKTNITKDKKFPERKLIKFIKPH